MTRRRPDETQATIAPLVVVMGVAGAGKTTLGQALARRLAVRYQDGDDLHPPANIARMSAGSPLTDADRAPWLEAAGDWLSRHDETGGIVSCSALKRCYRDVLSAKAPRATFVFLRIDPDVVAQRLARRQGHFWPPSLAASQFADLEPPQADEAAILVEADLPTEAQVEQVLAALPSSADPRA